MPGFIVRVRCTVLKDVIVEDCTEEQAQNDPFAHAGNELECDMIDYDVLSVHPND